MTITKNAGYANTNYCPDRKIKYIVIHYTAGSTSRSGSAYNTANIFKNPSHGGSADFIVDDSTVVQYSPDVDNYYCWHAGVDYSGGTASYWGKCTNANSIGIEICSTNPNYSINDKANSPKWSFTDAAVNTAIELTKYLMKKYNIPASNVIRHWDVCHKECPGIIGWNPRSGSEAKWQDFKKRLGAEIDAQPVVSTKIYRVRKSPTDSKTQLGAFTVLHNAKELADKNPGYAVYDMNETLIYKPANSNKKTVSEIAEEVIEGKWGNGSDRWARLVNAGYDYNEVQAEVNRLLRG